MLAMTRCERQTIVVTGTNGEDVTFTIARINPGVVDVLVDAARICPVRLREDERTLVISASGAVIEFKVTRINSSRCGVAIDAPADWHIRRGEIAPLDPLVDRAA